MKTLIIYYSYGGNTRGIAEKMKQILNADLVEIQTVKAYTGSYDAVVNQGQQEVNSGYMPEIQPMDIDFEKYDRILLGTPVWWYTFAPAMKTFLYHSDLSGKVVYPFATNGGWLGHTFQDFEKECKGAKVQPGLNIRFNGKEQLTKEDEIQRWIDNIQNNA